MSKIDILTSNVFANSFNHTLHAYIDISGGLVEGTLLSQIMYWFSTDKNGKIRARVIKDGELWIAKKRSDWWDEIRISEKQYDRAIKVLIEKKIIIVAKYKFDGTPMAHIRPNYEQLNKLLKEYLCSISENISNQLDNPTFTNGENGLYPKGKMEIDERVKSLTENTTEITTDYISSSKDECTKEDKKSKKKEQDEELFNKFWAEYPKKRDKQSSKKAFTKLNVDVKLFNQMMASLSQAKNSYDWQKNGGQYIPYPSTWLNGRRWEDELATVSQPQPHIEEKKQDEYKEPSKDFEWF